MKKRLEKAVVFLEKLLVKLQFSPPTLVYQQYLYYLQLVFCKHLVCERSYLLNFRTALTKLVAKPLQCFQRPSGALVCLYQ